MSTTSSTLQILYHQLATLSITLIIQDNHSSSSSISKLFFNCIFKFHWILGVKLGGLSTLKSMKMPKNILVFNDHDPFTSPDAPIRLSANGSHSKGHHFLNLRINRKKNSFGHHTSQEEGGWLKRMGVSVSLCARAIRAILNHVPIGNEQLPSVHIQARRQDDFGELDHLSYRQSSGVRMD